jgi:hypothetical protein
MIRSSVVVAHSQLTYATINHADLAVQKNLQYFRYSHTGGVCHSPLSCGRNPASMASIANNRPRPRPPAADFNQPADRPFARPKNLRRSCGADGSPPARSQPRPAPTPACGPVPMCQHGVAGVSLCKPKGAPELTGQPAGRSPRARCYRSEN